MGCRVKAVDYDASADVLYQPLVVERGAPGELIDSFARPPGKLNAAAVRAREQRLLDDPAFHAQFCLPNFACPSPVRRSENSASITPYT